jgi:uncharacterized protein
LQIENKYLYLPNNKALMNDLKRGILSDITDTLTKYPILAVLGPRQSGKTTFLKNELPGYSYCNLEDPSLRAFANADPAKFLDTIGSKAIIDEAQYGDSLFSYLQVRVDEARSMGQYVISGSQNFNLLEKITQSLAGRVALFQLFPFDIQEMKAGDIFTDNLSVLFTKGCYPAVYQRNIDPDRYYADYLSTYIKRDISQLINLRDYKTFSNFLKICAAHAGQLINLSSMGRDIGISHATARNWLNLLETSFIVFQLPPYFKNYSKRLVKSPKLYFYDTGLLCHLLGIRKGNINPLSPHWGHLFENQSISEFVKQNYHYSKFRDFYFWRDSQGHEIDLLYQQNDQTHAFEIKSSSTIGPKVFQGFEYFKQISAPDNCAFSLIYGGDNSHSRTIGSVDAWHTFGY